MYAFLKGIIADKGQNEVVIDIAMGEGNGECTCWGCDITYDSIKINGDYRT